MKKHFEASNPYVYAGIAVNFDNKKRPTSCA